VCTPLEPGKVTIMNGTPLEPGKVTIMNGKDMINIVRRPSVGKMAKLY